MPRVTFKQYLEQRAFLRLAWEEFDQLYSLLSTNQQWDLHAYYQPLHDYDTDWLKAHREHAAKTKPTLPAKAGRSFARMRRVYETGMAVAKQQHRSGTSAPRASQKSSVLSGNSRVTVRAIARPEPDFDKVAKVLLELVRTQQARKRSRIETQ